METLIGELNTEATLAGTWQLARDMITTEERTAFHD